MTRLLVLACALVSAVGFPASSLADEKGDVLTELAAQLKEMRGELNALRQENQRLQAIVAQQQPPAAAQANVQPQQPQPDPIVMVPGGSETRSLFDEPVRIYSRPGTRPPSWLDMLIENNRLRTMEAWARARENERLVDERLAKISAESRALGANYCPRPLRDVALSGGDIKQHRDKFVAARSSDFDLLFNQVEVKEYLRFKAARLSGELSSSPSMDTAGGGTIASAQVRYLTDRLRRDLGDATILYGPGGLNGPAPAGLGSAEEMMRRMRDSSNPLVSGPARDAIALGRRSAAVDDAVASDVDIDLVLRMNQIKEAKRRIGAGYIPSAQHIAEDLDHVNSVLNGKISRTRVPEIHAFEEIKPPKN